MEHSWAFRIQGVEHLVELGPQSRWTRRHVSFRVDGTEHRLPGLYFYREIPFDLEGHAGVLAIGTKRPSIRARLKGISRRRKAAVIVALVLSATEGGPAAEAEGMLVGSSLVPAPAPSYELFVDGVSLGVHH